MPTRGKASARMSVESILPAAAKASKFVSKGLAEILHFAMSKSSYLLHCLSAQFAARRRSCPNCGGTSNRIVDRKFLITQLRLRNLPVAIPHPDGQARIQSALLRE